MRCTWIKFPHHKYYVVIKTKKAENFYRTGAVRFQIKRLSFTCDEGMASIPTGDSHGTTATASSEKIQIIKSLKIV